MSVQPLTMDAILTSNQGIQEEEKKLETQMQALDPDSAEYEYDQLQLQRERIEMQIREENPNLDPQTLIPKLSLGAEPLTNSWHRILTTRQSSKKSELSV